MRISDWSSDVCSSDLQVGCRLLVARQPGDLRQAGDGIEGEAHLGDRRLIGHVVSISSAGNRARGWSTPPRMATWGSPDGRNSFWLAKTIDRKSTRLNSSH